VGKYQNVFWSWFFFWASLVGLLFTINAFRPTKFAPLMLPSFFASWLTNELAAHHLVWQIVATVFFVAKGALGHWPGLAGLAFTLVSWAGLAVIFRTSVRAKEEVEDALCEGLGVDYRSENKEVLGEDVDEAIPWKRLLIPFRMSDPRVKRVRNVRYAEGKGKAHLLDVYLPKEEGRGRPVVLQIHGGAWVLGDKREQGIPLLNHLASKGWVGFNANYGLAPRTTFPDMLVDLKRALAWVREHARDYGGDPDFIVVTGGSAGGHLTALMALTQNDPEYQPGFEDADTSLQAAVPFYGVYDFTDRFGLRGRQNMTPFLERVVMKKKLRDAPDFYRKTSPMDLVRPDAPPFFVIHGSLDILVPVGEARKFVEMLRAVSESPVVYAELPGAQHAFEVFPSLRTIHVIGAVDRFLQVVHERWRRQGRHGGSAPIGDDGVNAAVDRSASLRS
jgi:acetyl esterase/lipase